MAVKRNLSDGARPAGHNLDELQRGHEQAITLENIEQIAPRDRPCRRGQEVPVPMERPGAIAVGESWEPVSPEEEGREDE